MRTIHDEYTECEELGFNKLSDLAHHRLDLKRAISKSGINREVIRDLPTKHLEHMAAIL
jgi:hypothetical protein